MPKQIRLNLIFHTAGRHDSAWKTFDDSAKLIADVDHQIELAKRAEAAKFDAIFLPDTPGTLQGNFLRRPRRGLDPAVLLSAIAMHTSRLGLISTAPTQWGEPYLVARAIATLQQVSKGRAGWNVVTGQDDESRAAFGAMDAPFLDRDERYLKAEEFVRIVTGLWDSLPYDAIVGDVEKDIYIDGSRTKPVEVEGKYYSSSGVLQMPGRFEGARPVIFQAGISTHSRKFGAKWADAMFTSQPTLEDDRKFYAEVKSYAEGYGRNPDHLVVLPGLYCVVGDTEAEAKARKFELDELSDTNSLLRILSNQIEVPIDKLDPNKELPYDLLDVPGEREFTEYRRNEMVPKAKANKWTVKELMYHNLTRGQRTLVGTAEQIAETIIEWIDSNVSDGFNINVDAQPDGLDRFLPVITELQNRGRFRKDYEFDNFHQNLGLPKY